MRSAAGFSSRQALPGFPLMPAAKVTLVSARGLIGPFLLARRTARHKRELIVAACRQGTAEFLKVAQNSFSFHRRLGLIFLFNSEKSNLRFRFRSAAEQIFRILRLSDWDRQT